MTADEGNPSNVAQPGEEPMSEPLYTTDTAAERLARSVAEAVETGGRFSRAEFSVDDVSTVLESLQAAPWSTENLQIVNGYLVERGAYPPDYPAGAAYGEMPYSDAEPLVKLSELSGWPDQAKHGEDVRKDQIAKDAAIVKRITPHDVGGRIPVPEDYAAAILGQLSEGERRAPVQGGFEGNLRRPAGTITWAEHLEAWEAYDLRYHGQTAERIAERGGFGHSELKMFLGRPPTTFLSDTVGGPWTSHGHEISGITLAGPGRPPVARCGGPSLCNRCSREAEGVRWSHAGRPE